MKTILISILTASFIASTVPVTAKAADIDSVAGVIAGLVTLGLIAKAIDDQKDRDVSAPQTRWTQRNDGARPVYRHNNGLMSWDDYRDRPRRDRRASRTRLPDDCLRRVRTDRGHRQAYGSRCLSRNYAFADLLPRRCALQVRSDRGVRTVYGRQCLRREGFRVEARRDD